MSVKAYILKLYVAGQHSDNFPCATLKTLRDILEFGGSRGYMHSKVIARSLKKSSISRRETKFLLSHPGQDSVRSTRVSADHR